MARRERHKIKRLGEKLGKIRQNLGISEEDLLVLLNDFDLDEEQLTRQTIGEFEAGKREPSLNILLRYSRLGDVPLETLIDDNLDFPQ